MMHAIRIPLLLIIVASAVQGQTTSPMDRYSEAVRSYKEAEYRQAVQLFHELVEEGYDGYDLQFNLGTAAYKNGDLGLSVLSFERALVFSPGNEDVLHNLNVVRARLRDRVDPIPLLFFVQWWNDIKTGHRPGTLFAWSLAFIWLLSAAAFVFFGVKRVVFRRVALIAGLIFLVGFLASLSLSVIRASEIDARRTAVVLNTEVKVRSAADATGVESFIVHEGLKVEIMEAKDGQFRIRLADGKTGWIEQGAVERI